jgi:hypothetical protein
MDCSTICNDLDDAKAEKAVKALLKFEAKRVSEQNSTKLIDGHAKPILVQFQLKRPVKTPVIRPVRVKIPHSLFDADTDGEGHSVCLFCRSEDKAMLESTLEQNPIDGVTAVVSIDQVKKNFKAFKERKELFSQYSHFICDNRIFSHLNNLLGKVFSRRNNHPIPIEISKMARFEKSVMNSIHNSTYMHLSGQNITVRMGLTCMDSAEVVANVQQGIRTVVEKIGCGWGGILSVYIKSSDSPALPLHNSYANEMGEFVNTKIAKSEAKKGKKEVKATPAKKAKTTATVAATTTPKVKKAATTATTTPKAKKAAAATTTPKQKKSVEEDAGAVTPPKSKQPSPRATRSVVKKRALAAEQEEVEEPATKKSKAKSRK